MGIHARLSRQAGLGHLRLVQGQQPRAPRTPSSMQACRQQQASLAVVLHVTVGGQTDAAVDERPADRRMGRDRQQAAGLPTASAHGLHAKRSHVGMQQAAHTCHCCAHHSDLSDG